MTDRGRGMYGDPEGARRVLEALGGPAAKPRPDYPAPAIYRGTCGNRSPRQDGAGGCENEVAPPPNPLRLCEECLARYRAAAVASSAPVEPSAMSFVLLPKHRCAELDHGAVNRITTNPELILDANSCGIVDRSGGAVCVERRVFKRCDCARHPDRPTRGHDNCQKCRTVGYVIVERIPTNCGARFALDRHGLLVQVQ